MLGIMNSIFQTVFGANVVSADQVSIEKAVLTGQEEVFPTVFLEAGKESEMQIQTPVLEIEMEDQSSMIEDAASVWEQLSSLSLLSLLGVIALHEPFDEPLNLQMTDLPEQIVVNPDQIIETILAKGYSNEQLEQLAALAVTNQETQASVEIRPSVIFSEMGQAVADPEGAKRVAMADIDDVLISAILTSKKQSKVPAPPFALDMNELTFEGEPLEGYFVEPVLMDKVMAKESTRLTGKELLTDDQGVAIDETVQIREILNQSSLDQKGLSDSSSVVQVASDRNKSETPNPRTVDQGVAIDETVQIREILNHASLDQQSLSDSSPIVQVASGINKNETPNARTVSPEWRPDAQIVEHELIQQVVQKLSLNRMATRGTEGIRLELEPKELGALTIDITVHKNVVSADILTQSASVKEVLDKNQTILRDALSNAGFVIDQFSVNVGDFGQSSRHFLGRERFNGYGTDFALHSAGQDNGSDGDFEMGVDLFSSRKNADSQISVYV